MQIIHTAITWLLRSHPFLLASEVRLSWTRPGGGVGSQVRSGHGREMRWNPSGSANGDGLGLRRLRRIGEICPLSPEGGGIGIGRGGGGGGGGSFSSSLFLAAIPAPWPARLRLRLLLEKAASNAAESLLGLTGRVI